MGKESRIKPDVHVETKEGGLITIPEWHPTNMSYNSHLASNESTASW